MQVVILAGGLGTRLRPITENIPKAMTPVNGRPFLEYEINLLRRYGLRRIVLSVGYKANAIREHFGNGISLGVEISYSTEDERLLGPSGALKKAEHLLEDNFIVTYGDAYLEMDYADAKARFLSSNELGMMVVYKNHGKYGKSDVEVRDGYVTRYDKKVIDEQMVWINFGAVFLKKKALGYIPDDKPFGEEEFYNELIARRELLAYESTRRFYEIGNPAALKEFSEYIGSKN